MSNEIHIEKVTSGKEVHFNKGVYMGVILRFCPYCGSDNLKENDCWPSYSCLTCGLSFHEDNTQQNLDDFKEVQEKLLNLRKKQVEELQEREKR